MGMRFHENLVRMGRAFWATDGNGNNDVRTGTIYCMCVKKVLFSYSNLQ